MEPKVKRKVQIAVSKITESSLYPDGIMYEIWFIEVMRSGKERTIRMGTENFDEVIDLTEKFIATGVVMGTKDAYS